MSAVALLEQARSLGVSLRVDGDNIKARGPRPAVEQILPDLRQHKPELLAVLGQSRPDVDESGTDWLLIDSAQVFRLPYAKPKTRSELLEKYPGGFLLRLPDAARARELTALVARLAARECFSHDEISEALELALGDPDTALECFRALVQESH